MLLSRDCLTPEPALADVVPLGNGRSGQTLVQPEASSHVAFLWSAVWRLYTVLPLPSTSTVPRPGTLAVLNMVPGEDDEPPAAVVPVAPVVVFLLDDPHAAIVTISATPSGSTAQPRNER